MKNSAKKKDPQFVNSVKEIYDKLVKSTDKSKQAKHFVMYILRRIDTGTGAAYAARQKDVGLKDKEVKIAEKHRAFFKKEIGVARSIYEEVKKKR